MGERQVCGHQWDRWCGWDRWWTVRDREAHRSVKGRKEGEFRDTLQINIEKNATQGKSWGRNGQGELMDNMTNKKER